MSDLHPITAFRAWFASQPNEVQGEIAAWALMFHPVVVDSRPMREVIESRQVFDAWLDAGMTESKYRTVGKILHLRSVMDFFLLRHYGDAHEWEQRKARNEDIAASFTHDGNHELARKLTEGLEKFPEREQLWRAAAESWGKIANTLLSFEVLETWMEEERRQEYGSE